MYCIYDVFGITFIGTIFTIWNFYVNIHVSFITLYHIYVYKT